MPIYKLDHRLWFPPADQAEEGLLAVGGDLRPERLLLAYSLGIFPWYEEGLPILWHSPDPRLILWADALHVPRSLQKAMRKRTYEVRYDTAFAEVIAACARTRRPGQRGTWITRDMRAAYVRLHESGFAHSVEAWREGKLCGGLYGVSLGGAFFGESMFAHAPEASKTAFVDLVTRLCEWGIQLIDCQVYTEHLARFGAVEVPRSEFLAALAPALQKETRRGKWT